MPVAAAGSQGWLSTDAAGLLFIAEAGVVRRIDPATRRVLKERRLPGQLVTPPLRTDAAVFCCVEGEKGAVHVFSLELASLSLHWTYTITGGLRGEPTLHGRTLCVIGADRTIHRLQ